MSTKQKPKLEELLKSSENKAREVVLAKWKEEKVIDLSSLKIFLKKSIGHKYNLFIMKETSLSQSSVVKALSEYNFNLVSPKTYIKISKAVGIEAKRIREWRESFKTRSNIKELRESLKNGK